MRNNEEKFFFKTSDGLKLCGILSKPQKETEKCIVLCHGITVDKEEGGIFTELAHKLCSDGFAVFRFDFRGHGESEGESINMTIAGEELDLEAAVKFLQERGYKEFGILGASFAGGAVSFFASNHPKIVKALTLWNALIDYDSLINPVTDWGKKYWGKGVFDRVEKFGFTEIGSSRFKVGKKLMNEIRALQPWDELLKVNVPILFIHGDKDSHVPHDDSRKYAAMMQNANLVTIKGADHGFHDNPQYAELAGEAAVDFLKKYL